MRTTGKNIRLIVNDLEMSYTDQGHVDDPAIIFIHGFPFNKSMWDRQVEALNGNYRIVTYDIRGHGNSDTGMEAFSIDLFVNDLISFMDILHINKTSLCALSMGGYIALNAIQKYPERFNSLVLSDTQCLADSVEAKEKRMKAIDYIINYGVEKYAEDSVKNLFAAISFDSRSVEIESVKEMIVTTSVGSLCSTLLALSQRKETCTTLSEINVPVLIIVGEEDRITPPPNSVFMHQKINNSALHIIKHAGHLCCLENPEEFNEQLNGFLERVLS